MRKRFRPRELALAALVVGHLGLCIIHGAAHDGAAVLLTTAATVFVFAVILAGPVAGLVLWRWRPAAGAWIMAATLFGSLIFGAVNHFVLDGPDHVARVAADWRRLFATTAALLFLTELAGSALALRCALAPRRTS
jgi:hypothetical protein